MNILPSCFRTVSGSLAGDQDKSTCVPPVAVAVTPVGAEGGLMSDVLTVTGGELRSPSSPAPLTAETS